MSLENLEKRILSEYPDSIRVKGVLKKRKESLDQFIEKLLTNFNENKDTIFAGNRKLQTEAGKRRSIGDLFMICRYYYPKCTLQEVVTSLYKLIGVKSGFRSSYCFRMNKKTYYFDEDKGSAVYDKQRKDEYGLTYSDYKKEVKNIDY